MSSKSSYGAYSKVANAVRNGASKEDVLAEFEHADNALSVKLLIVLGTTFVTIAMLAPVVHFLRDMPEHRAVNLTTADNITTFRVFCEQDGDIVPCNCSPMIVETTTVTNELAYLRDKLETHHLIAPVVLSGVFTLIIVALKLWHLWIVYAADTNSIFSHVVTPFLSNVEFVCTIINTVGLFLLAFWLAGIGGLAKHLSNLLIVLLVGAALRMAIILSQLGVFKLLAPYLTKRIAVALNLQIAADKS